MFKRAVNAILAVREPLRHKYIHPICLTGCSLQSCIRRKTDYLVLWKSGWGTEGKRQCLPRPQRCCWFDDIIDQMDILQPVPSSARTQSNQEPQRLPGGIGGWIQRSGQTPTLGTRGEPGRRARGRKSPPESVTHATSFRGSFFSLCGQ